MKSLVIIFLFFALVAAGLYYFSFSAVGGEKEQQLFIVNMEAKETDVVDKLVKEGLIRNATVFNLILNIKGMHGKIGEGGYYLTNRMDVWKIIDKITSRPDLKWVVIPEGMRKEQIGEVLAKTLEWNDTELEKWNTVYTQMKFDYVEGVYFPDTYLIPVNESGLDVAQRMIDHFNEKFAPYFDKFAAKNILWTTGLKIASLIQREAGGKDDMPIISGVIWNRLDEGMKLQIDAEIQYAKGKIDDKWWSVVTPEDLEIDSPYNSYLNKGLPPHPISNPGLSAIDAALNPAETDCLYYLHDHDRQIHCAKTYEEHKENIKKYLQ